MRCKEAVHQLQLYIDNRLTIEQTRLLEAHITRCPACRQELALLEEVAYRLYTFKLVAEPADLNERIMQRIATTSQRPAHSHFSLLRPSLPEVLTAILLATIATLVSLLQQPSLRTLLPFGNGHDSLSLAFINLLHRLMAIDSSTLILAFWVVGTILGISITLVLAGNEMRTAWLKAMMGRLPVR